MKSVSSSMKRLPVLKIAPGGEATLCLATIKTVDVDGEQRTLWEASLALGKGRERSVSYWPSQGLLRALGPDAQVGAVLRIRRDTEGGTLATYSADVATNDDERKTLFNLVPKGITVKER